MICALNCSIRNEFYYMINLCTSLITSPAVVRDTLSVACNCTAFSASNYVYDTIFHNFM